MKKNLTLSLLSLTLSLTVALALVAGPARAQESQVFEFDYDQQGNPAAVTLPGAAAPASPTAQPAAPTAPKPPVVPVTPAPTTAQKDDVLTIVGEPETAAPPALSDDELFDLFAAPETEHLLPADPAPVATPAPAPVAPKAEQAKAPAVPAAVKAPAAAKAPATVKAPASRQAEAAGKPSVTLVTKSAPPKAKTNASKAQGPNSFQRRWLLAQKTWSRAPLSKAVPRSLSARRALYAMDRPGPPIAKGRSASAARAVPRNVPTRQVVELTRFP